MLHFKILILITVIIFSEISFSEEEKHETTENQTAQTSFSGQQDNAWMALQTELGIAKTKLDAEQAIVNELLANKKNNKGSISKDQVDQLNQHHQKLQDLTKSYNQSLNEFETKYPEKGRELGRQYNRKNLQSLDQLENSLTIDGRIRKINKKIKSQYKISKEIDVPDKKMLKTNAEKNKELQKPKTQPNDVTEKIIIVK